MSGIINVSALRRLADEWIKAGKLVAAPVKVRGKLLYRDITSGDDAALAGGTRPVNSIKEFFFPRHETLFRYRLGVPDIELSDQPVSGREQIIFGARPCDAAALPIIDHVFNWDYKDEFYNRRRRGTIVITVACRAYDSECFCTSTGSGPADESGSDAMLFDLGDGIYEVRMLTEKGRALFAGAVETSDREAPPASAPPKRFEHERITEFLASGFDSPFWKEQTLACIGCGACAYTCPACHCFDIVDEGNAAGGARVKNWDSCQFPMFTLHASGHNPREQQGQRQRQRIYHKFSIYPARFGAALCTGCGNCARNCPAGLGVLPLLEAISSEAVK